jgi:hypothetical protein
MAFAKFIRILAVTDDGGATGKTERSEAVNRLETRGPMMKFSAIFCAQLIVSAVALSMSGAAQAQEIGCVDNTPAPPITHSCPSTSVTGAYAAGGEEGGGEG